MAILKLQKMCQDELPSKLEAPFFVFVLSFVFEFLNQFKIIKFIGSSKVHQKKVPDGLY